MRLAATLGFLAVIPLGLACSGAEDASPARSAAGGASGTQGQQGGSGGSPVGGSGGAGEPAGRGGSAGSGGSAGGTGGNAGGGGSAGIGGTAGSGGTAGGTGGGAGSGGAAGGAGGDAGSGGSAGGAGGSAGSGGGANEAGLPSQQPPAGLAPGRVPMFVTIGFDDNAYSGEPDSGGEGGMAWATSFFKKLKNASGSGNPGTYDGSPARVSFYLTSVYISQWMADSPTFVKRAWHRALTDGHEIGNHTQSHSGGGATFSVEQWDAEISQCNDWLTKPFDPNEINWEPKGTLGIGASREQIFGFRTPFLEYSDATFAAVAKNGFLYDCSIEEGWQWDHDGGAYNWPYRLDHGSPGHQVLVDWGNKQPISPRPGLWEMPVYPLVIPPDAEAVKYGFPKGLRGRVKQLLSWFDTDSGKITGFDYNLWVSAALTKGEFLATLKYSFDLRLAGNRAPFMLGAHTDYYSTKYTAPKNATVVERREALEEFIRYALSKPDVRVVTTKQILDWIRNPVPLR